MFAVLLLFFSNQSHAAGGITHMFIAKQALLQLPDKELKNLIENNMDAYLVGSNYPDTGYMQGTHYGDASHWQKFIDTFVTYLHERYSYPEQQNPKLVAFLLGCATHVVSDQIFHGAFMHEVSLEDFHRNWQTAHSESEQGLDILILIDKKQWQVRPMTWWMPLRDLVMVYHLMGKNNYSKREIFWGNTIYSLTGIEQRAISPLSYYYVKWKMPWLFLHYDKTPQGGMRITEQLTQNYLLEVWKKIMAKPIAVKLTKSRIHSTIQSIPQPESKPRFIFAADKHIKAESGWYGNYHIEFI